MGFAFFIFGLCIFSVRVCVLIFRSVNFSLPGFVFFIFRSVNSCCGVLCFCFLAAEFYAFAFSLRSSMRLVHRNPNPNRNPPHLFFPGSVFTIAAAYQETVRGTAAATGRRGAEPADANSQIPTLQNGVGIGGRLYLPILRISF